MQIAFLELCWKFLDQDKNSGSDFAWGLLLNWWQLRRKEPSGRLGKMKASDQRTKPTYLSFPGLL